MFRVSCSSSLLISFDEPEPSVAQTPKSLRRVLTSDSRLTRPDSALRVAFVGQISSGKSSLINELTGQDIAEVDVLPTTDAPTIHEVAVDDASFRILDTPGLDGSIKVAKRVAEEAADADIAVWVLKANRPSREIDRASLKLFNEHFENEPERLQPPVLFVLTFMDKLAPIWPYAEHALPPEVRDRFEDACNAAAKELEIQRPIPASTGATPWNIASIRRALIGLYADGLKTQRNRARREARTAGVATNLKRSGSGAWEVVKAGARIAKRGVSGDSGSGPSSH
ncbi:GTPase family protein [Aliiruegeria lutimaris]|uniref:GTPase family protein n=1 Tax=Aliiruegeria lutimaris TaxID=571298 RepID=UPI000B812608|nr:GTPase [Aliiruegeria lutimaris]